MAMTDPVDIDRARRMIDYGLTADDFGPRRHGRAATTKARVDLGLAWPTGLAPVPHELPVEPDVTDPLPRADVLVVTWTAAEMLALADTLTPGVNPRTRWYRYARNFESYLPEIRRGAPSRNAGRLGSYFPTTIGNGRYCASSPSSTSTRTVWPRAPAPPPCQSPGSSSRCTTRCDPSWY